MEDLHQYKETSEITGHSKMPEKINIRNIFLQNFIFKLITIVKEEKNISYETPKAKTEFYPSIKRDDRFTYEDKPIVQEMFPAIRKPIESISSKKRMLRKISKPMKKINRIIPSRKIFHSSNKTRPNSYSQITSLNPTGKGLLKLFQLIKDPYVREIECTGSGSNILVKKKGLIQKTPIVLQNEDIESVLQEFSERTKIPIIGGTFKAALENIILTAVISKNLGTRFIITKKLSAQNQYQRNPMF